MSLFSLRRFSSHQWPFHVHVTVTFEWTSSSSSRRPRWRTLPGIGSSTIHPPLATHHHGSLPASLSRAHGPRPNATWCAIARSLAFSLRSGFPTHHTPRLFRVSHSPPIDPRVVVCRHIPPQRTGPHYPNDIPRLLSDPPPVLAATARVGHDTRHRPCCPPGGTPRRAPCRVNTTRSSRSAQLPTPPACGSRSSRTRL